MSASAPTLARRLPPDSRLRPSDPPRYRLLCGITIGLALAALVLSGLSGSSFPHHYGVLVAWALLVAAADIFSIGTWRGVYFGFDLPLLLAAAFLYGPFPAGVIALVSAWDVRELRGQISWLRAAANRSQIALSVMAAAALFSLLHGDVRHWPSVLLPALVAIFADMLVNGLFVVLAQRANLVTWRELASKAVPFAVPYAAYGLLAVLFSSLYDEVGMWAFVAFAAPLVLGREVFSRGKRLLDSREHLASQQGALKQMTERIGEERKDERAHIAAALHDDVLQALFNVSLHAQVVREDLKSGQLLMLEDDVPKLVRVSEEAAALLRHVIRDLRSSPTGQFGLVETLNLLIERLRDENDIKIESCFSVSEPSSSQQLLIYQVIREALTNSVRHAKASRVRLELLDDLENIRLVIEDDGIGFDPEAPTPADHFGLALMRERAEVAGGGLSIESALGEGTRVVARFPRCSDIQHGRS